MGDLFDIANLITTVGVDAVKIKPEPGLPEKSSNEILTELFSTFDVPDDDDDEEEEDSANSDNTEDDKKKNDENKKTNGEAAGEETPVEVVKVKVENEDESREKMDETVVKKKKVKKKHKHKKDSKDSKDKEKKHKHKKKSKRGTSESLSGAENEGSKKKKKKKKSKRKLESDPSEVLDNDEPSTKTRKLDKTSKEISTSDISLNEKLKPETLEVKIKKEKIDPNEKAENFNNKEKSPQLPPISKRLDDDTESLEVPKLLEKSKSSATGKILIKDLKNSEVYNNVIKEVENKKKEKAERMEDGEITDSNDEDENNRTPTLSPSPPLEHSSSVRSGRKYSTSPTLSNRLSKKNDLRHVLKEKEKKKLQKSRSRSKTDRKNIKKSKSKDRTDERSRSCHSREKRSRSRSGDRSRRGRGRSKERRSNRRNKDLHSRDDDRYKSRSEDRNRNKWRGRSRSRERKERIEIDKKKLLEIARRNAINMIMKGKLPLAQQDKAIAAIQAGGKSIEELTDFCKSLSKSEAMGELSSISSDDESGSDKGFHHPFLIKERPNSIIMNIRDAKQLPTKTLLEKTAEASNQLRLQYPVSSGQQHRKNESEWVPVSPKPSRNHKPEPKKMFVPAKEILQPTPKPLVVPPMQSIQAMQAMQAMQPMQNVQSMQPSQPLQSVQPLQTIQSAQAMQSMQQTLQPVLPFPSAATITQSPLETQQMQQQQTIQQQSVYPAAASAEPVDISAIVSQRLAAMRKLSENPNNEQALNQMNKAQNEMKIWIESKQNLGRFTGSTGVKVLTPAELNSGQQAWARKDQLLTAQPVSGGMGMALLQKMGWKPGEGLGKNKEGTLEPLQLEVKLDKRGLISDQDIGAAKLGKVPKVVAPPVKTLEGKHPVSLLGEYCSKRKYGAPVYELCFECGPDHKKNFIFKVKVNGMEYKPAVASPNKKLAKAEAAQVCLQAIGLLPILPNNVDN